MSLPPEPAALQKTERYSFGDAWHARDSRALIHGLDALEPKYGKLRTGGRNLPVTTSPQALRRAYAASLEADGWTAAPELDNWPWRDESYAFGWHKAGKVFAIVGLEHRPQEAPLSPVNIITNIGDRFAPV